MSLSRRFRRYDVPRELYAIHPGYIKSVNDSDRHYIGFIDLVRLYKVSITKCILWDDERSETFRGRKSTDYIHLYPMYQRNRYDKIADVLKEIELNKDREWR